MLFKARLSEEFVTGNMSFPVPVTAAELYEFTHTALFVQWFLTHVALNPAQSEKTVQFLDKLFLALMVSYIFKFQTAWL